MKACQIIVPHPTLWLTLFFPFPTAGNSPALRPMWNRSVALLPPPQLQWTTETFSENLPRGLQLKWGRLSCSLQFQNLYCLWVELQYLAKINKQTKTRILSYIWIMQQWYFGYNYVPFNIWDVFIWKYYLHLSEIQFYLGILYFTWKPYASDTWIYSCLSRD